MPKLNVVACRSCGREESKTVLTLEQIDAKLVKLRARQEALEVLLAPVLAEIDRLEDQKELLRRVR